MTKQATTNTAKKATSILTATIQAALTEVIASAVTLTEARGVASTRNQVLASALDRVCHDWTLVKGNAKYDAEKLNDMKEPMYTKVVGMRAEIIKQFEEAGVKDTKSPMRDIARRSIGYTGSKALHPKVKKVQDAEVAATKETATKAKDDKPKSPIEVARVQVNNSITALHMLIDEQGLAKVDIVESEQCLELLMEAAKLLAAK